MSNPQPGTEMGCPCLLAAVSHGKKLLVLLYGLILLPGFIFSQIDSIPPTDSVCIQRDLPDEIARWFHKKPKEKTEKTNSLLLVPVLASNPATGFQLGVAGQYVFKDKTPGSLYSSVVGNATVTTKDQVMLQVKNNIYKKNNKMFLSGDYRFFLFTQDTYGLSTAAPDSGILQYQYNMNGVNFNDDSLVQPMRFNHIRFHQTVSWEVKKFFYVGVGYHLDHHYAIVDAKLDTVNGLYTSHYAYSKIYGYDPSSYTTSGVSLNLVWDTRDNLVNAYTGYFANINVRVNPEMLGSSETSTMLNAEFRSFYSLSKRNPRHVLAFWLMGNFTPEGRIPYLDLPAIGYDQRGRSGRGFIQGRYRGPDMIYGETEYRFPISKCGGILGGVLFVNATTANNPTKTVKLFQEVAYGFGFGLRIMVDKKTRTNIQVDQGFSRQSGGVYFGAADTF